MYANIALPLLHNAGEVFYVMNDWFDSGGVKLVTRTTPTRHKKGEARASPFQCDA
jgi:hypothetical protein